MPPTVMRFERLAYLCVVLGVSAYYNDVYQGITRHQGLDAFFTVLAGVTAAAYVIVAALIFAAARRRQNWARWIYSVLIVLGVAIDVRGSMQYRDILGLGPVTLLDAASDIAAIASVYFAFSRPSNAWFRGSLSASEDRPR
jgi:hypothetical protein